jgi:2-keto-4-pentenoate hydratase
MNTVSFANFIEKAGRARLMDESLPELTDDERPQSEDQGYAVRAGLADWFARQGRGRVVGYKIGATTSVMQQYLGVDGPSYGHMMSAKCFATGAWVSTKHSCKTGVEAELAIVLGKDIPPRATPWVRDELVGFIKAVAPAIEIVENRYGDIRSAGLGTLIADDFFHKACVLGQPVENWKTIDLPAIDASLSGNGEKVESGKGAEVLGDPLNALVWLVNIFARQRRTLRANDVVLTGSMTPVHWVEQFPFRAESELSGVGTCAVELA